MGSPSIEFTEGIKSMHYSEVHLSLVKCLAHQKFWKNVRERIWEVKSPTKLWYIYGLPYGTRFLSLDAFLDPFRFFSMLALVVEQ